MKRKTEHEETKMRFLPFLFPSLPFPSLPLPSKPMSFLKNMVIWSFCRFLCLVIGFVAYLLKIGRNESRRRTISFSSYSIGIFPFSLLVLSFPVYFPVFFFFLPFFHFSFIFPSFLLSIFIPPTNLQPSCGRG